MGLEGRKYTEYSAITDGLDQLDLEEAHFTTPLVNVIPFACEACPTKSYLVTNNCRRCLAHPCTNVCPKNAVSIGKYGAVIDQDKCIKCGRCEETCPYNAIIHYDRPCASVCGVKAIDSDYLGRAHIDEKKCVACGRCLTQCPFGAIADKSACQSDALHLPTGQVHASRTHDSVGPVGEFLEDIVALRQMEGPQHLFPRSGRLRIRHVVRDGGLEQPRVLEDDARVRSQPGVVHLAHMHGCQ